MWLPPAVFVRIAPGVEAMQFTAGNVLLALRATRPCHVLCASMGKLMPSLHETTVAPQNTMPIESTAHFEVDMDDDDQAAAYRDEPTLNR